MSSSTMNFALPEAMRSYVDLRVPIGHSAPSAPRAPSLNARRQSVACWRQAGSAGEFAGEMRLIGITAEKSDFGQRRRPVGQPGCGLPHTNFAEQFAEADPGHRQPALQRALRQAQRRGTVCHARCGGQVPGQPARQSGRRFGPGQRAVGQRHDRVAVRVRRVQVGHG